MSEAVLRSCPFCGGAPSWATDGGWNYLTCDQCGVWGKSFWGKQEAVAAWNKRPTEDALVEALEQVAGDGFVSSSLLRDLKAALAKARGEVAQ